MNFIKTHLISKIKELYKSNENLCDSDFLFFDEPIKIGMGRKINRINQWYPFCSEEIVYTGWNELPGRAFMEIYFRMKEGKFYGRKIIEGKRYKLRRRCSET